MAVFDWFSGRSFHKHAAALICAGHSAAIDASTFCFKSCCFAILIVGAPPCLRVATTSRMSGLQPMSTTALLSSQACRLLLTTTNVLSCTAHSSKQYASASAYYVHSLLPEHQLRVLHAAEEVERCTAMGQQLDPAEQPALVVVSGLPANGPHWTCWSCREAAPCLVAGEAIKHHRYSSSGRSKAQVAGLQSRALGARLCWSC